MEELNTKHLCPNCDHKLDAHHAVENEHQPGPGDISVCVYCGQICELTDDMALIKITDETLLKLTANEIATLRMAKQFAQEMREEVEKARSLDS